MRPVNPGDRVNMGDTAAAPAAPARSLVREVDMAYYVILANFTDQGVRTIKDSPKRADAFRAMAEKSGVKINALFWTLGQHDVIAIAEADDDIAATALSLSVTTLGNIRTQTLRAFDAAEMREIVGKMP
jgi:uncharacterized protein with GYD domain